MKLSALFQSWEARRASARTVALGLCLFSPRVIAFHFSTPSCRGHSAQSFHAPVTVRELSGERNLKGLATFTPDDVLKLNKLPLQNTEFELAVLLKGCPKRRRDPQRPCLICFTKGVLPQSS